MQANNRFVSATDRAHTAISFVYVVLAFALFTSIAATLRLIENPTAKIGPVESILIVLHCVGYLLCGIFFLRWMHRVYANLPLLGALRLRFTPGWAAASFFIPLLCLVYPLYAMREIWVHSDPLDCSAKSRAHVQSVPTVGYWWGCFLVMALLSRGDLRMSLGGHNLVELFFAYWSGVLANLMAIPAALLAAQMIRNIDAFQTEKHARLQAKANFTGPAELSVPPRPAVEASDLCHFP